MLESFKVCYHGTTTLQHFKMMESQGIQLDYSATATDYGQGFYVTTNLKQAELWAARKATKERFEHLRKNRSTDPTVVKSLIQPVALLYALDYKGLSLLKGKKFESPGPEWADFIMSNRLAPIRYTELTYDYAVGPVADGDVYRTMLAFKNGSIMKEEFYELIQPQGRIVDCIVSSFLVVE